MEDYKKIIGENVHIRRRRQGITGVQLADRAGCSPAHLYHIERGTHTYSLALILRIAKALGCTLDDLMKESK